MRSECQEYLIQALKDAGIKNVYVEAKDAVAHTVMPYAELLWDKERMRYNGSLVAKYDSIDDEGRPIRILRRRIYDRILPVEVKIVHREGELSAVVNSFTGNLARRIFDSKENAIAIKLDSSISEDSTSRLKGKEVTYFLITFEGGVYADYALYVLDLETQMVIENEMGGM